MIAPASSSTSTTASTLVLARVPATRRAPLDRVLDPLRALGTRLLRAAADAADPVPWSCPAAAWSPVAVSRPGVPRHVVEARARFDALAVPAPWQGRWPRPGRGRPEVDRYRAGGAP